jgi:ferritin-like metal-binding protein YciE
MKDAVIEDMYADEIKVLHDAEREIAKRLPKLAAGIGDASLRESVSSSAQQSLRLQHDLADILGRMEVPSAGGASCRGIASLLDEVERAAASNLDQEVRDSELALGIERLRDYQASGYRAVQAYARKLGHEKDAARLGTGATNGSAFESMYANEIKVLHAAEREIAKRLPRLAEAASAGSVREVLTHEVAQIARNQSALADILERLSADGAGGSCRGISSLLDEVERVLNARIDAEARDAELALGAERVRQYLAAGYRAVQGYARKLGLEKDAAQLESPARAESHLERTLPALVSGR